MKKKQHNKKAKKHAPLSIRDIIAISLFETVNKMADEKTKTILAASKELGLEPGEYTQHIHWPVLVARRCYAQADAFLAARGTKPA